MTPAKPLLFVLALVLSALLGGRAAKAACGALCSCTASSSGVSFGAYSPLTTSATTSTGSVTVTCILVVELAGSYTVELSSGTSGSFTTRTLKNGSSSLSYNLYTSASLAQVWGDGTGGTQTMTGSFPAALLMNVQTFNIFGNIPGGQNVPMGSYADTITVTVSY
jgi:spore coat protein U-like protein